MTDKLRYQIHVEPYVLELMRHNATKLGRRTNSNSALVRDYALLASDIIGRMTYDELMETIAKQEAAAKIAYARSQAE